MKLHVALIPFASCVRYYTASGRGACGMPGTHTYVRAADGVQKPANQRGSKQQEHTNRMAYGLVNTCYICTLSGNVLSGNVMIIWVLLLQQYAQGWIRRCGLTSALAPRMPVITEDALYVSVR